MKTRDRIALGIGGLALLVSVMFVGGILRWTQALVAVLVAGALGTQLFARRRLERMSPLVGVLLAAILLTAIQLIPLPEIIRNALDPQGEALRSYSSALSATSPWPSLSLDPSSTLRALCFYTTLLGVAVLALRFAAAERSRFILLAAVALTCGLAAAVTGAHTIAAADSLFGLYQPLHATPPVLGPLLNTNHLGSLMALGAVLSVGLAFYSHQVVQLRVAWILIALGCSVVAFATASRGAALNLALGVATTSTLLIAGRLATRNSKRKRTPLINELPIAIVVSFGLGLAVFTSAGRVADQLDQTSLTEFDQAASKYAAWKSSFEFVKEAPVFGIGRGALEPALTRVHDASAYVTFSHLENEYIQALVEWGVPGAILLACAAAWCIGIAARRWRDGPLASAAIGAMVGVLFHSSVDFGVELLGLAVPVTIVAATVLYVPLRETAAIYKVRLLRVATIAGLVLGAFLLLLPWTTSVDEDHDDISDMKKPSLADLRPMIERHPLDYYGFAQSALSLMADKNGLSVRYLNHALTLHPTLPGLHRLAARMLGGSGRPTQASIEFSIAMHGSLLPHAILSEIVAEMPNADLAALSIPVDYAQIQLVMQSLQELKRGDVAVRWLNLVVSQPQENTDTIDKLYELAMERKDLVVAEHAARLRFKVANTTTSHYMLAKVLYERKDYDGVMKELADVTQWHGRIDEQAEAWLITCDVHIEHKEWDVALECLHRLDGSGLAVGYRRDEISKRIKQINDDRRFEAREQALEAVKKSMGDKSPSHSPGPL